MLKEKQIIYRYNVEDLSESAKIGLENVGWGTDDDDLEYCGGFSLVSLENIDEVYAKNPELWWINSGFEEDEREQIEAIWKEDPSIVIEFGSFEEIE